VRGFSFGRRRGTTAYAFFNQTQSPQKKIIESLQAAPGQFNTIQEDLEEKQETH